MDIKVLRLADEIATKFDKPELFSDFFNMVVAEVCMQIDCELASLLVVSRRSNNLLKLKSICRRGAQPRKPGNVGIHIDEKMLNQFFNDEKRVFIYDAGRDTLEGVSKQMIERHAELLEPNGIRQAMCVFLTVQSRPFGFLLAFNKSNNSVFSQLDLSLFRLIARQSQYAYRNLRRSAEIKKINEIGIELNSSKNTAELLQKIGKTIFESFSADIVSVLQYSEVEKNLIGVPVIVGDLLTREEKRSKSRKNEIALGIIQDGENQYEPDASGLTLKLLNRIEHDSSHVRFVEREKIVSTAALLLKTEKEVVGVMFVSYRRLKEFTDDEKKLMEIFASYAAIALRNRLEMGKVEVAEKLRFSLNKITEIRNSIPEFSDVDIEITVSKILLESILGLLDADTGLYGHIDDDTGCFVIEATSHSYRNLMGEKWDKELGITGKAVRTREIQILEDVNRQESDFVHIQDLLSDHAIGTGVFEEQSSISIPFVLDGQVKGVFHVDSINTASFTEEDRFIIQAFIDQAERAIQNLKSKQNAARRLDQLRRLDNLISTSWDLKGVMRFIVDSATALTEKDQAISVLSFIETLNGEEILLPYAHSGFILKKPIPKLRLHSQKGLSCRVGRTNQIVNVTHEDPLWKKEYVPVIAGMKSCLSVPLILRGKAIGVINVESPDAEGFDQEDVEFLMTLAGQSVIMFQMRAFLNNIDKLQLARLTNSRSDFAAILLDAACDLVNGNAAVLWWYNDQERDFSFGALHGEHAENLWSDLRFGLDNSFTGISVLNDSVDAANLEDNLPETIAPSRPRFDVLLQHGYQAIISIPLLSEPEDVNDLGYIGAINIYLKEKVDTGEWGKKLGKKLA